MRTCRSSARSPHTTIVLITRTSRSSSPTTLERLRRRKKGIWVEHQMVTLLSRMPDGRCSHAALSAMVVRLRPVAVFTDDVGFAEPGFDIPKFLTRLALTLLVTPSCMTGAPGFMDSSGSNTAGSISYSTSMRLKGFLSGVLVNGCYSSYAITGMAHLVDAKAC